MSATLAWSTCLVHQGEVVAGPLTESCQLHATHSRHAIMEYQYTPLDPSGNEIRLLHLLPDEHHDAPRILLKHCRLTDDDVPDYEALSYTWGDAKILMNVAVGRYGGMLISVTENLATALPYLRKKTSTRVLWIEAICVDQRNLKERGQQVSLMPALYSRAHAVVVWLGQSTDDSNLAVDGLEILASKSPEDWSASIPFHPSNKGRAAKLPLTEGHWRALHDLFKRPWFGRLWVVQEVRLGGERVVMQCGERLLPWSSFTRAELSILHLEPSEDGSILPLSSMALYRPGMTKLYELLHKTKSLKCQDPRDKVYALLSLCADIGTSLQADYTKSLLEVYTDVACKYVELKGKLHFFRDITSPTKICGLPSWVPDWSAKERTFPLRPQYAAAYSRMSCLHASRTELGLQGRLIDTVKDVCVIDVFVDNRDSELDELVDLLLVFAARNGLLVQLFGDLKFIESLCRVLYTNDYMDSFADANPGSNLIRREARLALVCALHRRWGRLTRRKRVRSSTWTWWHRFHYPWWALKYTCSGRSLLLLESGRLGLGPDNTMPGDRVSLLLGFSNAMILDAAESGKYKAVGEAYIDGYMQAEALLGPLPDSTEMLMKSTSAGNYVWMFRDRSTGDVSFEDPRLGPLPPGWSLLQEDDLNTQPRFVNRNTGESLSAFEDPRCDADSLAKREVQLDTVTLV